MAVLVVAGPRVTGATHGQTEAGLSPVGSTHPQRPQHVHSLRARAHGLSLGTAGVTEGPIAQFRSQTPSTAQET